MQAFDLVGQGCAAALPNLQLGARAARRRRASEHVLSVCVEVSSAAMYLDNDPGVLISACLFGDGAGAAVLSRDAAAGARRIEWKDSASLIEPAERKALMFEQRDGMLRNILTREVPALAADYAQRVLQTVLGRAGLHSDDVAAWIMHAGGRDVLLALETPLRARRRRLSLQRGDTARVRQPVERVRLLRARGRARRRRAGRLVVAVVVRRRLQLPRRAARGG